MTRTAPRTNFNSSSLVRCLADLALVDAHGPGHAFAERLGRWLDVNDAIALHATHTAGATGRSAGAAAKPRSPQEDFARVRAMLVDSIIGSCSPQGGGTRLKLPTPLTGEATGIAISYEPYHRFHLAHQRDMESAIRPLRARIREALAAATPELARLAALDASFDGALGERESKLLATLPLLLEKRFEQLRQAYQQAPRDAADDPALWMRPGGWLASFGAELQTVLLAELDLRLQPAQGLIEAFGNETTRN